jgi:hypothetical protein
MGKNKNIYIDVCQSELRGNKKDIDRLNNIRLILLDTTNMPVSIHHIISGYSMESVYTRMHSKLLREIGVSLEAKRVIADKYVNNIIRVGECMPYFDIWTLPQKPCMLIVYRDQETLTRMVSMWRRYIDPLGQTNYRDIGITTPECLKEYCGASEYLSGMQWCGLIPIELCKITIAMDGYISSKIHWSIEESDTD